MLPRTNVLLAATKLLAPIAVALFRFAIGAFEPAPMNVFELPRMLANPDPVPTAVFALPMVSANNATSPTATLEPPVVFSFRAESPTAVLSEPLVAESRLWYPTAVLANPVVVNGAPADAPKNAFWTPGSLTNGTPPMVMTPEVALVVFGRINSFRLAEFVGKVWPGAKVMMPLAAKERPVSRNGALPPAPKNRSNLAEGLVVLLFKGSARKPKASVFEVPVLLLNDDAWNWNECDSNPLALVAGCPGGS